MPLYSTACPLPINRKISRHKATSAPFSPTDIAGLGLWLKADAGVTVSGGFVTTWADQSGNGNNASIATIGEEPTFISSFSNAKPAIQFNGTTQIMQIPSSSSINFLNTSAFIVLKYLGEGTGNNVVYLKNADAGLQENPAMYGLIGYNGDSAASFSMYVDSWVDYPTQIDISGGDPTLLSMTYDGDEIVYLNGVLSDTFEIGGNIETSTGLLQIGGYNKSFDSEEYFYGQIAEIIMYDDILGTEDREQVETYLNSKYAIY